MIEQYKKTGLSVLIQIDLFEFKTKTVNYFQVIQKHRLDVLH